MKKEIEYLLNKTSTSQIAEHLSHCDADFLPILSNRVKINEYAQKISNKATRFEAWSRGTLVGLVAAYCNDRQKRIAYITSISVLPDWRGMGVAKCLLSQCIQYARESSMRQIRLEVASGNTSAIKLYEGSGFVADVAGVPFVVMSLNLQSGEENEQQA